MSEAIPVRPLTPLAPYVGGKRNLAGAIIARIEEFPHTLYAEPFVGSGGVFLRRRYAPKAEVINDLSRDVTTFFRILQRHYVPFMDMLKFQLTSRTEFERLAATDPSTLTDLERAARFLYLQRTSFGGKVTGRSFGVVKDGPARFDITRLATLLEAVHERLSSVVIECLGWPEFVTRYDRTGALFYLDPPYWGTEHFYGRDLFERGQYELLAERLSTLQGAFILSLNDVPQVRRIFRAFAVEALETTYTVGGGDAAKRVGELIITSNLRP
jgi:DNA adenine methylase